MMGGCLGAAYDKRACKQVHACAGHAVSHSDKLPLGGSQSEMKQNEVHFTEYSREMSFSQDFRNRFGTQH